MLYFTNLVHHKKEHRLLASELEKLLTVKLGKLRPYHTLDLAWVKSSMIKSQKMHGLLHTVNWKNEFGLYDTKTMTLRALVTAVHRNWNYLFNWKEHDCSDSVTLLVLIKFWNALLTLLHLVSWWNRVLAQADTPKYLGNAISSWDLFGKHIA